MSIGVAPAARGMARAGPPRFVVLGVHPLMVEALVTRIRLVVPDAVVAFEGSSIRDAVRHAADGGCDCAVVDLDFGDAVAALDLISTFTMHGVPVIGLTGRASAEQLEALLAAGISGYVDKHADARDVCEAVAAVLDDHTWFPSEVQSKPCAQTSVTLSDQERRAFVLYASGMTQDMVARRMGIASSTVKHYLDRVREKYQAAGLPVRTKIELHARARAEGLIP